MTTLLLDGRDFAVSYDSSGGPVGMPDEGRYLLGVADGDVGLGLEVFDCLAAGLEIGSGDRHLFGCHGSLQDSCRLRLVDVPVFGNPYISAKGGAV